MAWLPKNYKCPTTVKEFMKIEKGENKIRILSEPVMGWEDWIEKKPYRFRIDNKPKNPFDPKSPVKFFWAFVVFNYALEKVEVLSLTQASVRNALEALTNNSDWGDPIFYDIKIIRSGEGMQTEYAVNPVPHKPLDEYIFSQFKENPCNLDAIFDGEYPFSSHHTKFTPLALPIKKDEKIESMPNSKFIDLHQVNALELLIEKCGPEISENIKGYIKKEFVEISKIPCDRYELFKKSVAERVAEYSKNNELPF